jgi:cystathionine beta-lyase
MSSPFDGIGAGDDDIAQLVARRRGVKWQRTPGALAAWVADMDIPPAGIIRQRLHELIGRGDVGYPQWAATQAGSPAREAFIDWARQRWQWTVDDRRELVELCDVVQGIQLVLWLCTQPGDGVIVHTPAYPPMLAAIDAVGAQRVDLPAQRTSEGSWDFDLDELEQRLAFTPAKALLLCHPHNPTGRVFERAELEALADLAQRHDLVIISDEIHADLTYAPRTHVPMASLSPEVAARTVTLNSPSKAFNLAGLRYAIAHIGVAALRERLDALPNHLLGAVNLPGAVAATAAWTEPGAAAWLNDVVQHLDEQRQHVAAFVERHLPGVRYAVPEATYLAWLDVHAWGWGDDPSERWRHPPPGLRAVDLSPGPDFGPGGRGFVRLNFATSTTLLERIVVAMGAHHTG